jgi:hypothetical protein
VPAHVSSDFQLAPLKVVLQLCVPIDLHSYHPILVKAFEIDAINVVNDSDLKLCLSSELSSTRKSFTSFQQSNQIQLTVTDQNLSSIILGGQHFRSMLLLPRVLFEFLHHNRSSETISFVHFGCQVFAYCFQTLVGFENIVVPSTSSANSDSLAMWLQSVVKLDSSVLKCSIPLKYCTSSNKPAYELECALEVGPLNQDQYVALNINVRPCHTSSDADSGQMLRRLTNFRSAIYNRFSRFVLSDIASLFVQNSAVSAQAWRLKVVEQHLPSAVSRLSCLLNSSLRNFSSSVDFANESRTCSVRRLHEFSRVALSVYTLLRQQSVLPL